jgi:hypothetical protein
MNKEKKGYEVLEPPKGMKYLPTMKELKQLEKGDLVKVEFMSKNDRPSNESPSLERMWVIVEGIIENVVVGCLDNVPIDIPELSYGDVVHFPTEYIISIYNE